MSHAVVGSIKEGTRVFDVDEADIMLSLPYRHEKYLTFDKETQAIRFVGNETPEECILNYKKENGELDSTKLFMDFLSSIHRIISTLDHPNALGLTMDPLSTSYHPCLVCMNVVWDMPQTTSHTV